MKRLSLMVVCAVLLTACAARAQDAVKLEFKGEKGRILKYDVSVGGAMDADLDQLPVPNSTLVMKNARVDVVINTFFKTENTGPEGTKFQVRGKTNKIILGKLVQLTDLGEITSMFEPNVTMTLTPQGKLQGVEIGGLNLPGMGGDGEKKEGMMGNLMGGGGMDMVLPMLTSLFPPVFPEEPVKIGGTWSQAIKTEEMPLPILPKISFDFTLDSVDGDIAHISFVSKGDFDGAIFNSFLPLLPEFPLGEDKLKIDSVSLLATWDTKGVMLFNVAEGRIENVTAHSDLGVDGGGKLKFTHADDTSELWNPRMKLAIGVDGLIAYKGDMTPADFALMFPEPKAEPKTAPKKPAAPAAKKPAKGKKTKK